MNSPIQKKAISLQSELKIYNISPKAAMVILVIPALVLITFTVAWFIPFTHKYALWMSKENKPVELFTFLFLFFGGIFGMSLAWWLKTTGKALITWVSIGLFSVGLVLIAMEEISWGQQFLKFETPESLMALNEQDELTLHNIQGLHGNSEYFHLFFGLAGLIGIWFNLYFLNQIRVPKLLVTCFSTIVLIAIFDLSNDFLQYEQPLSYFTRRLSEVNEMLIGLAGFMYIMLLNRKFRHLTKYTPKHTTKPVNRDAKAAVAQ